MLMRFVRVLAVLLTVVAALSLCGVAIADTCNFGPSSGLWDNPNSWDCNRVPDRDDDVVIGSGKTCIIEDEATLLVAYCRTLDVDGTLRINSETLVVGRDGYDTTSNVDGIIYFENTDSATPRLVCRGGVVTINGTGRLDASKSNGSGYEGALGCCAGTNCAISGNGFKFGSSMTIKGSLQVSACMELNGTAKVDHADDVMSLGGPGQTVVYCGSAECTGTDIFGTGKFKVSKGKLEVLVSDWRFDTAPDWEISCGAENNCGTIQVGDANGGQCWCDDTKVKISMTGGTLDFQANFTTTHAVESSGGKIKKKANKTVVLR